MSFTDSVDDIVSRDRTGLLVTHSSWKRVRLGTVCSILNGFPFPSGQFTTNNGFPLVRIRDVLRGKTDTYFAGPFDDPWVIKPGDLLVGMDGDFNSARWSGPPALLNQRVCRISPDERFYSIRFLAHALPAYLSAINAATPSMTVKHLSSTTIAEIPLPLPPTAEQLRIADALDDYVTRFDEARMLLARVQRNLKRYRAAVLQAAVEGRLVPTQAELCLSGEQPVVNECGESARFRPQEPPFPLNRSGATVAPLRRPGRLWGAGAVPDLTESERSRLPAGWRWVKVRELGCGIADSDVVQVGPMSMRSADFTGSGVSVLNVGSVQWGMIDESKVDRLPPEIASQFARYTIRPGDVLFTRSGTVGRCAVAQAHHDGWLMTFHLLRVRPDSSVCFPEFLRFVFEGAPHIRRQTREASIGTTRSGFNTNLLAELDVPLPPLREQLRIIETVDTQLANLQALEGQIRASLTRCQHLRQAILRWAFEGKLVDQDPADEPASVMLERIRMEAAATSRAAGERAGERRRGRRGRMSAPGG